MAKKSGKPTGAAARKGGAKLRAAVIGVGGIGRHHLREYAKSARAEVVAVCDSSAEALEAVRKEGVTCEAYQDYKAMLAEARPDVVSVCLPNNLHAPVTIAALEAGAHVLCEKPLATSAADAARMVETARRRRLKLGVNLSYRFNGFSLFLHELAEKGEFGEVYFAHTVWHRRRGVPRGTGWFVDRSRAGGGPLIDLGVHRLDLAWWLMGRPRPVRATGVTYAKFAKLYSEKFGIPVTTEDLAAGFVRFANGAALSVQASWAGNTERHERMVTRLWGTKAGAVQENVGDGYDFTCRVFRSESGAEVDISPHPGMLPAAASSVEDFCLAVAEGKPMLAPGEDGLAVQKMLDAIYRSAELGREVEID